MACTRTRATTLLSQSINRDNSKADVSKLAVQIGHSNTSAEADARQTNIVRPQRRITRSSSQAPDASCQSENLVQKSDGAAKIYEDMNDTKRTRGRPKRESVQDAEHLTGATKRTRTCGSAAEAAESDQPCKHARTGSSDMAAACQPSRSSPHVDLPSTMCNNLHTACNGTPANAPEPSCSSILSPSRKRLNISPRRLDSIALAAASPGGPAEEAAAQPQERTSSQQSTDTHAACAVPHDHTDISRDFDPSCSDHVTKVKNILAISGSRQKLEPAPLGRQQQYQQLYTSLVSCGKANSGRSIYISGLPGTGKSFTVQRAIGAFSQEQHPSPITVTINCMALKDTKDVYSVLLAACEQALSKGKASSQTPHKAPSKDAAYDALVSLLQSHSRQAAAKASSGKGSSKQPPLLVVVLEEVDRLLGKGPEEVYKLFMLPHTPGVSLVLLAIANSLDLTERMLPALKCRGVSPDFICFPAYSKSQVQGILAATMQQLPWKVFDDAALELVARSVSSTTGDLRHAFKVCQTALDMLVEANKQTDSTAAGSAAQLPGTTVEANRQLPAAAAAPRTTVCMREMMHAVRTLSGSGTSSASIIATVKALPNQQQLVLLATSMVIAGADAASIAVKEAEEAGVSAVSVSYAAERAKKHANPFAAQAPGSSALACSTPPSSAKPFTTSKGTPATASRAGSLSGDAALRVSAKEVYERYSSLCKELFMRPVPLAEFHHTCVLLAEQALLNIVGAGSNAPRGRSMAGCCTPSSKQTSKLSLKVLAKDVRAALETNPIYKKIIGA